MRVTSLPTVFLAAAIAGVGVAGGAAASGVRGVTCGTVITADTKLVRDVVCSGDGLTVAAAVTLDLNGHAVVGSGVGSGIALAASGATVAGGAVHGFETGVRVFGSAATVREITATGNGTGLVAIGGDGGSITNSDFSQNSSYGVWVRASRWTFTNSHMSHNGGDGFFAFSGSIGLTLSGNQASGNGGAGIRFSDFDDLATISRNNASLNGGDGIVVSSSSGVVTGNTAHHNAGNGITRSECCGLQFALNELIAENVAEGNGGYGIQSCTRLSSAEPCAAGMVDGGGNFARHNGLTPECVNVVCRFSPGRGGG